ncbi:type I secretion target repeat protein [Oceanicola granulosus HTCC2516]|uniref:Type I secretion target repeat protein n=2 Tax=Oceanicola granulosus TaxID=252302 RepID=Q2CJQ4_OCEGH|nr:type I secretion target repeat protein [Oceanicola granulosus HTCC2516]
MADMIREIRALEKRVLLDANLEWSIGASDIVSLGLEGMASLFEDQFEEISTFFEDFRDAFESAEALLSSVVETADSAGGASPELSAMVETIKSAVDSVRDTHQALIDTIFSETGLNDVAVRINSEIETTHPTLTADYSGADLAEKFTLSAFAARGVDGAITDLIEAKYSGEDAPTKASLKGAFKDGFNDGIYTKMLGGTNPFSVDLTDVTSGTDTIIGFTQNTTNSEAVDVTVTLPKVTLMLDRLIGSDALGFSVGEALETVVSTAESFSFTLTPVTTMNGGALEEVGLDVDGFDVDTLFEVGGVTINLADLTDFRLGFVSGQIDTVELGKLGLFFEGADTLTLGARLTGIDSGSFDFAFDLASTFTPDFSVKVQEVGAAAYTDILTDTSYEVLKVDGAAALDIGGSNVDFDVALGVGTIFDSSAVSGAESRLVQMLKDVEVTSFLIDITAGVTDPTLEAALEEAIQSMAVLAGEQIKDVLTSLGVSISSTLANATFDVAIPFTDVELGDAFGDVRNFFLGLPAMFEVSSESLGYGGEATETSLRNETTEQTGNILSFADLSIFASFNDILEVTVLTGATTTNGAGEDVPVTETVEVNLQSLVFTNLSTGEALDLLIDRFNTAFAARGLFFENDGNNALKVKASEVGGFFQTFTLADATLKMAGTNAGLTLGSLGFDSANASTSTDANDVTRTALSFLTANTSAELGAIDFTALAGVGSLRFDITVDGVLKTIDVAASGGSWSNVAGLVADLNAAFTEFGAGIAVSANSGGDGLAYSLTDGSIAQATLRLATEDLLVALDIDGLITWVNVELDKVLSGASLALNDDGSLVLSLPDVTGAASFGSADPISFSAADLGLGDIADLTLSANLEGDVAASFSSAIGIDFGSLFDGIMSSGGATTLGGKSSLGDNFIATVLDSVFLEGISLDASVRATASSVTGGADIGLAKVALGGTDPTQNFIVLDAQMRAALVGEDGDGAFSDRMSFGHLYGKLTAGAVGDLIGTLNLEGGIATDDEGNALDASGAAATALADIEVRDGVIDSPFAAGSRGNMLYISIGDIEIDVVGIGGLPEDAFAGLTVATGSVFEFDDTTDINIDSPLAESLTGLGEGDILDVMTNIATMLQAVGETFEDNFPFLGTDIPLLNFSVLDSLDFATSFLEALQDLRDDPQMGLDVIDAFFEGIFGADTVTLTWDAPNQTIDFALELDFLQDYSEEVGFQVDLAQLLGDQLADVLGAGLADLVTGLVDAKGDASFIFDPDLSFNLVFGIDLAPLLVEPTVLADDATALDALSTVGGLVESTSGANDLRIAIQSDSGTTNTVSLDVSSATDMGELIALIDSAIDGATSGTASVALVDGVVTFTDSRAEIVDTTGVTALFGAAEAEAADNAGTLELDFDAGYTDYAAAVSFALSINDGEAVTVSLDADATRTTQTDFVDALNTALQALSVARALLSEGAITGTTLKLSQLVRAVVDGGTIKLRGTDFATASGYDPIGFKAQGIDQSETVTVKLTDLTGANVARLLGFSSGTAVTVGEDALGETIYLGVDAAAPRVFLDTDQTELRAELTAGSVGGLNVSIGLGPISANVTGGSAYISDGTAGGGPAFISLGLNDIDGDANDGEYDLSDLRDIFSDASRSFLDLFDFDMGIGIFVDLPLSDSFGFFDPATDGLEYSGTLLEVVDNVDFSTFTVADLGNFFQGDLISLFEDGKIDISAANTFTDFELTLPDLSDFFSNFNIAAFLNDPIAVIDGLESVMGTIERVIDDYMSDIDVPIVGDALSTGLTFFDDFRYAVLDPARDYAEQPKADGSLPTTVDLITGFLNDEMNDLLGTTGETYLQAFLNTDDPGNPYLYAALNFTGTIFSEMLDIDFDFGIPGFNMEVEDGSEILLELNYLVNLGFGIDGSGFFLLNDTDQDEIAIEFLADAGSFTGSMSVLNLLGVSAAAVEVDGNDNVIKSAHDGQQGIARVTAGLGADLYGDSGTEITSIDYDLSGIAPVFGSTVLDYEKLIYFGQLDTSNLIAFDFSAEAELQLTLEGNVLNPTTGDPITIGGVEFLPTVATELLFSGDYTLSGGLSLDKLEFSNVRIDLENLVGGVLDPILDPIRAFIDPLNEYFGWLNDAPFSYMLDAVSTAFPILKLPVTIADTIITVTEFVADLQDNDYKIIFGDYDFSGVSADESFTDIDASTTKTSSGSGSGSNSLDSMLSSGGSTFGQFGSESGGFLFKLPLLQDPFSAINLLTGDFESVDLVEATFSLFNFDYDIDIVQSLLNAISAPGWVQNIINGALSANISAKFFAGFTVGYDLGGIANFVNTLDPIRLLDGVYIDAEPGSLIEASFELAASLNAGIAGLSGSAGAGVDLAFNDPDGDGKLRLPELTAIIEAAADEFAAGDIIDGLEYLFVGSAYYHANLSVWAGINLPWPLPDLKFSFDVFDFGDTVNFGGTPLTTGIAPEVADGGTAVLNIGANAGNSFTKLSEDGDDKVVISGPNSPYSVSLTTNGGNATGSLNQNLGSIVAPLGDGTNVLDMSGVTSDITTVTIAGSGKDTIILPKTGLHVVVSGDDVDSITTEAGSSGTYIIFAGAGADRIDIKGGNVVVLGGDDYGIGEKLKEKYIGNGDPVVDAELLAFLGINADGTLNASGGANYTFGGVAMNLAGVVAGFTEGSQQKNDSAADSITVGAGNHVILGAKGADEITFATGSGDTAIVLGGAGADQITGTNAGSASIEAGAGQDRVVLSGGGSSTIFGWGAAAATEGLDPDAAVAALARADGADMLIGGDGADTIHGQYGGDIIIGGLGDDVITGGLDNDILIGGAVTISDPANNVFDPTVSDLHITRATGLVLTTGDVADGNDSVSGNGGQDVVVGGGGNDWLRGGALADLVVGDFGTIGISSNLIAESFTSLHAESANAGTDDLEGGSGGDILVAGGAAPGDSESVTDLLGDNTVLGDFGTVTGARILEGVTGVVSIASNTGGADSITLGNGNDIVLAGEGNDVVDMGGGGDIVIGDLGTLDITAGTIETSAAGTSGDDTITLGSGFADDIYDIVLGGGGNDTVTSNTGGLAFLGDDGSMVLDSLGLSELRTYSPLSSSASADDIKADEATRETIDKTVRQITSDATAAGGNDSLTTSGGTVYSVLGGGSDTATLGDGDAVVLGDDGTIELVLGGSPEEVQVQTVTSASAGGDTLSSGSGRDLLVGGDGADSISGGDGANVLLGDSGTVTRPFETGTDIDITADVTGNDGNDTITGGADVDLVIGGGGDDTITLGEGANVAAGDGGVLAVSGTDITLTSTADSRDGADNVSAGSSRDILILGGGSDEADLGDGDNLALGDSGELVLDGSGLSLTSESADSDGGDSLTTGAGNDLVVLGGGADDASLGNGTNALLGDSGTLVSSLDFATLTLTSASILTRDGADSVTSGSGRDVMILGGAGDTAALGDGDNLALGDSGTLTVDATDLILESTSQDNDGSDDLSTGEGNDLVVLGGDADIATLGDGTNALLGDSGTLTSTADFLTLTLTSATDRSRDGADSVTAGSGRDVVVLGGAGDTGDLGDGDNLALGDSGLLTIDPADLTLTSQSDATDGDDSLTTGTGNDLAILGGLADTATLGDGTNALLGDSGTLTSTADFLTLTLTSATDRSRDGADSVTSGSGRDVVVLGGAGDTGDLGDGDNLALGDSGLLTIDPADLTLVSESDATDGDDSLTTGAGADLVVLGGLADTAALGDGTNAALGDSGTLTSSADFATQSLASATDRSRDGADSVTSGSGRDSVILGGADDSADLGDGDNAALGDSGTLIHDATGRTLVSEVDVTDGDDSVTTGLGNDVAILGTGSDSGTLGEGDNAALGDSGTLVASADLTEMTLVSDADITDGDDSLTAGAGRDLVILGGANDTADLGDGDNSAIGDSGELVLDADGRTLTSASADTDGVDTLTTGSGDDAAILGGAGDTAALGEGDNSALGDSGSLIASADMLTVTLESVGDARDGDDSLTAGAGRDLVILGGANDTADLGDGDNSAIGDSGELVLDVDGRTLTSASADTDGIDTLTTGSGDDAAILGGAGDTAVLGEGDNSALGDSGSLIASADMLTVTLESVGDVRDGDDSLTAGAGRDLVILGGANDTADLGDGDNSAIGDSGELVLDADGRTLTSASADTDGIDSLTTGSGDDAAILGGAGDTAVLGEGDNSALGDSGSLIASADMLTVTLESVGDARDGDDSLTAGAGRDLVILGGANDTADLGDGDNSAIGDSGELVLDADGRTLTSASADTDGVDTLTTGSGDDAAILGGAGDTAVLGEGDNLALGDSGSIAATADGAQIALSSVGDVRDGDDSVTAGAGHDFVVLGGADDTAALGDGDNLAVGDSGLVTVVSGDIVLISESADTDGVDSLTTGLGDDTAILGGRGDTATLGEGDNIALGDSGAISSAFATLMISLESDGNLRDGDDSLTAGAGRDLVILGGANDTADLGDGDNSALGDSGELIVGVEGRSLLSNSADTDGIDLLTTGSGDDAAVLGARGDTALLGEGDNIALGDSGQILASADMLSLELASTGDLRDGNDSLVTGAGRDVVILGGRADTASLGDGDNSALGDSGDIKLTPEGQTLFSGSAATDGIDSLTTGIGDDTAILGGRGDTAILGEGDNSALGDSGSIVASADLATIGLGSESRNRDGDDSISAGAGRDLVILGGAADIARLGDGDNSVLGDSGGIGLAPGALALESRAALTDAADLVVTGAGQDLAILGGDDDVARLGDGDNGALGDSGRIAREQIGGVEQLALDTTDAEIGGNDTITTGLGEDALLGGMGDDNIRSGDGRDALVGDNGEILWKRTTDELRRLEVRTTNSAIGGDDKLRSGAGHDVALGGVGDDLIETDTGDDAVAGDNAAYLAAAQGGIGELVSTAFAVGGDDRLMLGRGDDLGIGGGGDDVIKVGNGNDFASGDSATLTFLAETRLITAVLTDVFNGGDDRISAKGTSSGDNILIGAAGADEVTGGGRDDLVAGDVVTLELQDPATAREGQSHVDRLLRIVSANPLVAADDVLDGGPGDDIAIGGFGDDLINGGSGQDFLFGDLVNWQRVFEDLGGGSVAEAITFETMLPYVEGGYDVIRGGDGPDVLVGSLGPDLFVGNTAQDQLFGDSYWGLYLVLWESGFSSDTPTRLLSTLNFPGFGANDLVSLSQTNEAISNTVNMDLFLQGTPPAPEPELVAGQRDVSSMMDGLQARALQSFAVDYFSQESVRLELAQLMLLGADAELLGESAMQSLLLRLVVLGVELDASQMLELRATVWQIIEAIEAGAAEQPAGLDDGAANTDTVPAAIAAE